MKKSYRGFVIWMVAWTGLLFAVPFAAREAAVAMRLICNLMTLGIAVLTNMITWNECIYWYTGVSFEEAEAAGTERRRAYARANSKPFTLLAAVVLVLSITAQAMGWSMWIDFTVASAGVIIASLSTIRIRL